MKHKFEGIGEASATATLSAIATSSMAWAATGVIGRVVFALLKWFYMALANRGLILLNVGIAHIQVMSQKENFDGTFDEAFKALNEKGSALTDEEKKQIDDRVISALRKFVDFGVRDGGNS